MRVFPENLSGAPCATPARGGWRIACVAAYVLLNASPAWAEPPAHAAPRDTATGSVQRMYIREYRVVGARILKPAEIGETVYPFLGPGRTTDDIEQARAALEKIYKDKGYQTVTVQVPLQEGRGGIIYLEAVENKVGRLRIQGSRYFSLDKIKKSVPSLAEGTVPNFNDVTRDIVALNQWPDRRVTPTLRPGIEPGTVDIDLTVKDTFPLHASVELNNRYSANTTPLRLNGSVSYNNLWQLGHALGLNFQLAPERPDDARVFSAYYLARFQNLPGFSLMIQGTKQDSNVSTLGGSAVAGRGEVIGARANFALPGSKDFYHSLSLGLDYKHFDQAIILGPVTISTPITYYPLNAAYSGTWFSKGRLTELNAGVTFHFRGLGSADADFDERRFNASGSFLYLRGDLAHTHDLRWGFQIYGKVQGQASSSPLLDSEQFSGGGLNTARGYLESEVVGDNAIFGTLELRTPSLLSWWSEKNDWRLYAFLDGGILTINDPLPEQTSRFDVASYGFGSRFRLFDHFSGSVDLGLPFSSQTQSAAGDMQMTFRVSADF
jgi:hemolysin activation/secretion protein